jgi:glycosyltransferase involved in cell wall biosynthesis
MQALSVVINCRNAERVIGKTLESLSGLTDDVLVFDNGSTDNTLQVVQQYPVRLVQGSWEGFGPTKRKANALAKYDWILSLDADEGIDAVLKESLLNLKLDHPATVYDISFKNFFGNKWLQYGEWGGDHHIRLFNRSKVNWNDAPVHEELILPANFKIEKLKGAVLHRTAESIEDYQEKLMSYAVLNAEKYYQQGKKTSRFKKYISAIFNFLKNYIFKLGFLDGAAGYRCAVMMAQYTYRKYELLEEMNRRK